MKESIAKITTNLNGSIPIVDFVFSAFNAMMIDRHDREDSLLLYASDTHINNAQFKAARYLVISGVISRYW